MKSFFVLVIATLFVAATSAASTPTLPELVTGAGTYNILVSLLQATDLLDTVVAAKGVTIFAPTDAAFARTARQLGCKGVSAKTPKKIVNCLSGLLTTDQVKTVLTYHVVGTGMLDSTKVLKRSMFRTLSGKVFMRNNLELIDLAAGIRNPRLVPSAIDLKYDNGIVHTISRVLIPFINLVPPCGRIESPLPIANERFITLRVLYRKARTCPTLRVAVRRCNPTPDQMCRSPVGKRAITRRLSTAMLVGAVTTCKPAARAAIRCK